MECKHCPAYSVCNASVVQNGDENCKKVELRLEKYFGERLTSFKTQTEDRWARGGLIYPSLQAGEMITVEQMDEMRSAEKLRKGGFYL